MRLLPEYRTVWRWHFYSGLFCIPFVLVLSLTGLIYLFKPQIEAWSVRPYSNVASVDGAKPASEQIKAVLATNDSAAFVSYEMPPEPGDAGRIVVRTGGQSYRYFVHPESLAVLYRGHDGNRLVDLAKTIHGELMLGSVGSYIVELAACWTIVLVLTGLFIWWPRTQSGMAGVVFPRLRQGSRVFWRDLHAVTGFWVCGFVLILILTGLPWAAFWGNYLKSIRRATGTAVASQEWSVGSEAKVRIPESGSGNAEHSGPAGHADHSDHAGHSGNADHSDRAGQAVQGKNPQGRSGVSAIPWVDVDLSQIDRVIETIRPLGLADPIIISPPPKQDPEWTVRSMTGNRPQRATVKVAGATGVIVSRERFEDRHVIDRMVGIGIALHEGQLFGSMNQAIGAITIIGLMLLCLSASVLWWRRRKSGLLGASRPLANSRLSLLLWGLIAVLAILLPVFGASLFAVLVMEWSVLRRISPVRRWLGLGAVAG